MSRGLLHHVPANLEQGIHRVYEPLRARRVPLRQLADAARGLLSQVVVRRVPQEIHHLLDDDLDVVGLGHAVQ